MSFSVFHHVRVAGVSTVVPRNEVSIDDELEYYGNDLRKVERIKKMVGLHKRRIAPEGVTASDLCAQAAERLFADMGVERGGIDAVICITQSPDYPVPATAFVLQHALGLGTHCAAFDVNLGCAGYVYGLWLAGCMVESRARTRVLLLVGDAYYRYMDPANRVMAPVFGDAGSATLVEFAEQAAPLSFSLGSDGAGHEAIIRPGGGARIPHLPGAPGDAAYCAVVNDPQGNPWSVGGMGNTWMDGMAIFDFTMNVVPGHIRNHLEHARTSPAALDRLILHQANKQIVRNIADAAGFAAEQAPWETVSKYGNQACASIPGAICDQLKSACDEGAPLRLMLCGYGIGLAWASCIGDFSGLHCSGVQDFIPPAHSADHEERIAYWHKKFSG